jgi:hypothetical protein
MCQAMRWAVLPVAGGLYDQHPKLLDEWSVIFEAKSDHERQEAEKQKREMESKRRSQR